MSDRDIRTAEDFLSAWDNASLGHDEQGNHVPDPQSSMAKDLRQVLAARDAEIAKAQATVAAMREAVLEQQLCPSGPKMFLAWKDGKEWAMTSNQATGFLEALDAAWKSDDVRRWSEEFRHARDVEVPSLRLALTKAQERILELDDAVEKRDELLREAARRLRDTDHSDDEPFADAIDAALAVKP